MFFNLLAAESIISHLSIFLYFKAVSELKLSRYINVVTLYCWITI